MTSLDAVLRSVSLRVRAQRALQGASLFGAAAIAAVLLATLVTRFGYTFPSGAIVALALGLPCLGALLGALQPVAGLPVARALDRSLATPDLLSSAVEFSALPQPQQSAFMRACVAQAEAVSAKVSPSHVSSAAPFALPRSLPAVCGLSLALLMLSQREATAPLPEPPTRASRPPVVHRDTLAAFAQQAESVLSAPALDPEAREVARSLNALVQALADGEIDRAQALAELRKLEERLQAALAEDPKALQDALDKLARALAGNPDAKPLQEAIEKDWPEAPKAAERLAERLEQPQAMSERAAERLASSLKKAAAQSSAQEKAQAIEAAKRELERLSREQEQSSSLKRKEQQAQQDRLLKRKQRELDRLEREHQKSEQADRSLDRLKRDLDDAAQALDRRDPKSAAQDMRDAAQSMREAAQRKNARDEAQRLKEQLAQLRAELGQKPRESHGDASQRGQQGQQGQQDQQAQQGDKDAQQLSLERFRQLAAGQQGAQGSPSSDGQQTAMSQRPGQQGAQGAQGARGAQDALVPGSGQGEPAGAMQMPGSTALMPGAGGGTQPGAPGQDADGARGGLEGGKGGKPGSAAATASSGQHSDTRVTGEKRGGPTRSEIILESGQRGFASEDYARVHGDYARHAESVLEQEHIPGGYRFYVRRYFQMIRPRIEAREDPRARNPSTNAP